MFSQCGKTGDYYGKTEYDKQNNLRCIDIFTCNDCGEKSTMRETVNAIHRKLKEDA